LTFLRGYEALFANTGTCPECEIRRDRTGRQFSAPHTPSTGLSYWLWYDLVNAKKVIDGGPSGAPGRFCALEAGASTTRFDNPESTASRTAGAELVIA